MQDRVSENADINRSIAEVALRRSKRYPTLTPDLQEEILGGLAEMMGIILNTPDINRGRLRFRKDEILNGLVVITSHKKRQASLLDAVEERGLSRRSAQILLTSSLRNALRERLNPRPANGKVPEGYGDKPGRQIHSYYAVHPGFTLHGGIR
ncbi:hypothetical protein HY387_00450 [Candidatus Daviesbacteria bacterium]|nr:hypothetical protein [Candidatus Daviesbacteria bacterium]